MRALDQQARGKLAVEAGDFQRAFAHALAAELLRLTPPPGEVDLPRPSKKLRAEWARTLFTRGRFPECVTLADELAREPGDWEAGRIEHERIVRRATGRRDRRVRHLAVRAEYGIISP
jgi:hypothetical protein